MKASQRLSAFLVLALRYVMKSIGDVILWAIFLVLGSTLPVAPIIVLAWLHVRSAGAMIGSEFMFWIALAVAWIVFFTKSIRHLFADGSAWRWALFFVAFCMCPLFSAVGAASFFTFGFPGTFFGLSGLFPGWVFLIICVVELLLIAGSAKASECAKKRLRRVHLLPAGACS